MSQVGGAESCNGSTCLPLSLPFLCWMRGSYTLQLWIREKPPIVALTHRPKGSTDYQVLLFSLVWVLGSKPLRDSNILLGTSLPMWENNSDTRKGVVSGTVVFHYWTSMQVMDCP